MDGFDSRNKKRAEREERRAGRRGFSGKLWDLVVQEAWWKKRPPVCILSGSEIAIVCTDERAQGYGCPRACGNRPNPSSPAVGSPGQARRGQHLPSCCTRRDWGSAGGGGIAAWWWCWCNHGGEVLPIVASEELLSEEKKEWCCCSSSGLERWCWHMILRVPRELRQSRFCSRPASAQGALDSPARWIWTLGLLSLCTLPERGR